MSQVMSEKVGKSMVLHLNRTNEIGVAPLRETSVVGVFIFERQGEMAVVFW